ncbi:hypothetical protein CYLTODRAFT_417446 [Cylindrobasidium torrendii FP15055 ss-10]|uniref:C2 domain-containing protein n=1 Tax=Cylindrobasidium torrendii FP15055 ss-10 TaxID=1314674 RepID=A0A0D7BRR7_9AGAR|nr:hypothetical protein CYLTODRAFT_417446 [Cylindrobasidium torrendii FP15055 ss-10]
MSNNPREIGTLIIVIDKANHLPNKRHIGKQDPYCAVEFEGRKGRTKTIKRGGQHPEWDEEIRFPVFEDIEDELARTADESRAPSPPPKDGVLSKSAPLKTPKSSRSKRVMKLACWADDARDPELIGETMVDLTTVLTKGEQDEWHHLSHKEKFAGKVYLELTFYSNEEPPPKKSQVNTMQQRPDYAGPGDFIGESKKPRESRTVSTPHRHPGDFRPNAMRNPSGPMPELYNPPYDPLASATSRLSLSSQHSRRESFPPLNGQHFAGDPAYEPRHAASLPPDPQGYESDGASYSSRLSTYGQHPPVSATPVPSIGKLTQRPRYSVPASSSGFMPLNPARPMSTHPSEPSGFSSWTSYGAAAGRYTPMPSQTPIQSQPASLQSQHPPLPSMSMPSLAPVFSQAPMPIHTPAPVQMPTSSSMPYQHYPYAQYQPPAPQQYAPPQQYRGYATTPSPPNEPNMSSSASLNSSHGPGSSRPLPQPAKATGPTYPPPIPHPNVGTPPYGGGSSVLFPTAYSGQQGGSPPRSPLPPHSHSLSQGDLVLSNSGVLQPPPPPPNFSTITSHALPVPPPPSPYDPHASRRRASLPQPPSNGSRGALPMPPQAATNGHHPLPQPPSHLGLPRVASQGQIHDPSSSPHNYTPGPPPRPPQMGPEGYWAPPLGAPPPQQPVYGGAGWS